MGLLLASMGGLRLLALRMGMDWYCRLVFKHSIVFSKPVALAVTVQILASDINKIKIVKTNEAIVMIDSQRVSM